MNWKLFLLASVPLAFFCFPAISFASKNSKVTSYQKIDEYDSSLNRDLCSEFDLLRNYQKDRQELIDYIYHSRKVDLQANFKDISNRIRTIVRRLIGMVLFYDETQTEYNQYRALLRRFVKISESLDYKTQMLSGIDKYYVLSIRLNGIPEYHFKKKEEILKPKHHKPVINLNSNNKKMTNNSSNVESDPPKPVFINLSKLNVTNLDKLDLKQFVLLKNSLDKLNITSQPDLAKINMTQFMLDTMKKKEFQNQP